MGFECVCCDGCGASDAYVRFEIHESPDERQPLAWRGTASIPLVTCNQCGLSYLNPRYDDERLEALYQDPRMFVGTIDPEGRSRSIVAERALRVARCQDDVRALKHRAIGGTLLDVGCGLGFYLEALGQDFNAVGLEWSRPVVEMARDLPLTVHEARFPEHPFHAGAFDIVSLQNVLDHLPNPLEALQAARALLKRNGLLALSLVNFGSLAARVYGPGFRLLGPNHLYYFTPRTLSAALDRSGFGSVQIEYPYFGTEFARPLEHAMRIVRDWWSIQASLESTRLSPPFYGNMMRVFARAR
jgi:SAM-dependent methyltransferase